MADAAPAPLSRLLSSTRVLALVGLAKNTGKTVALAALLRELEAEDRCVGVTSIGRDGEEHDVIDVRIDKPRIFLAAGNLVASTGALLRASGVAHERLTQTGVRTPLGEVIIARLTEQGAVEVAGPSAAEDVREVGDAMIGFGAELVLIDGAIDRRAASSPDVADGLVLSTGAILSTDLEEVVARTRDAVELVRLPVAGENAAGQRITVARRLALDAEPTEIATLLREHPQAMTLDLEGALGERFLEGLLAARKDLSPPTRRELRIVAGDPTKVFLSRRGPGWYRRQGLSIEVLQVVGLKAITINPIAPQSHRFDSQQLREMIEAAIPDVPVLDVLDPSYLALAK
jgi:hypothetical protein